MIYDGPPSRTLPALVGLIRRNLDAGMRCMYLNSPAMVAGARSQLYAAGTDVEHEVARGALVLASASDHLVDGRFDIEQMVGMLDAAVDAALADGYAGLFATGDMTWELGPAADFSKLIDYEWCLEQLFIKQPALSGICQYHVDVLPRAAVRDGVVSHAAVFVSDTLTRINPHYALGRSPADRKTTAAPGLDDMLRLMLADEH
jgi:hypothetical protein